jgi:hypothetical protein
MPSLIIEYQLDTRQPGYAYQRPTPAYSEALMKAVWRQAMPRGKGWNTPMYQGARSLKCFPVSEDQVALSLTTVTDQVDETGRRGIRRTEIDIISMHEIVPHLRQVISAFPESIQISARKVFTVGTWARIIDHALPRIGKTQPQLVFTHASSSMESWQIIEAVVLNLAVAWPMHALPGWGKFFSFTTFALTNEDESRIVALPAEKVQQVKGIRVIPIR